MADYGLNTGRIIFAGLLGAILTIVAIVGLLALFYWQLDRMKLSEELLQPSAKLETLTAAQQTRLTDYRMLDAEKGIVAIPISRAMDLVVAEEQKNDK